jgi:tetratricopeptide (TPR) repeat protein
MENLDPATQSETSSGRDCANCGQPALEGAHPTALCGDCREHFTRLTIPHWIKAFAGAIVALLLFSLYTLPGNIALGIHLHKGEKAVEQKNYNTAEKELKLVTAKTPYNVEANGHLLLAAFYNQDFEVLNDAYKKIHTENIEDAELLSKIDFVLGKAVRYAPGESFDSFTTAHPQLPVVTDTAWRNYFARNPNDPYAMMEYSSMLYDKAKYAAVDSMMNLVLKVDNEYSVALMMQTSAKRELGDLEGALAVGGKILSLNHESVRGLSTQARTLLRMKRDQIALDMALKASEIDPENPYARATLILAYHFNGYKADRDALMRRSRAAAAKDSTERTDLQYALDVMDHKEKFRD